MPLVEMRRRTRVFGARVLRSGRRLSTTPEVIKYMRKAHLVVANVEHDWIELLDHGGVGGGSGGDVEVKRNGWCKSDEGIDKNVLDIDGGESRKVMFVESTKNDLIENGEHDGDLGTKTSQWGLVYTRKRKRSPSSNNNYFDNLDKKFGMKFSRKESRKTVVTVQTPSDSLQNVPFEPSLKSKSRKRKRRKVIVSKRTQLNVPNLRPRNRTTFNCGIRKRRSSLKSRKQRKSIGPLKFSGGLADGAMFLPIKSNPEIFKSIRSNCCKEVKEVNHDIDSASCNASILVIESDRCYRQNGAVITLEMLDPNQWFLLVKKDGVERFRVEARNVMRPCFCNRVTHAIIWAGGDESWKLEFPDRQDWVIFKELYRKCYERTEMKASLASMIPVPRVNEVQGYAEEKYLPFNLPDSYIRLRGDEVSRLLVKSDPVYDMDSEDDEWLNKFNVECDTLVDNDTFEKIIDAYEKGIYVSPDDYSDVTLAVDRCLMLASKEILEVVYDYWMTKRKKKKHSALIRAFQFYKPGKSGQPNFNAVLRKKRSFRQRGNQAGRGKQVTFLKALCDKNVVEEAENVTIKVQETVAAANRAEVGAIMKRQRAQLLMEVADLLTYKAAMALKISEARASSGSVDDTIGGTLFSVASSGLTDFYQLKGGRSI